VQRAGDVRRDDCGDERADPDDAMYPQAENGREQQNEGRDGRDQ
jgi:hypothetical protein